MSEHRDPRLNPRAGDLIMQLPSKYKIRVTDVDGDSVSFAKVAAKGFLSQHNKWNIRGWREMVAKESVVLEVAP